MGDLFLFTLYKKGVILFYLLKSAADFLTFRPNKYVKITRNM